MIRVILGKEKLLQIKASDEELERRKKSINEIAKEIKSNLMEDFDGSSVLEIEEVIKKDGLLDFYGNTGDQ